MTKWKCSKSDCMKSPCVLETRSIPITCPFLNLTTPEWEKQEEPATTATTAGPLPDWCKVGEWTYDKETKEYFKITKVDYSISLQNADGKGQYGYSLFTDSFVQARLRPWTFEEAPIVLKVKDSYSFALAYLSPFGEKYIIAFHYPDEKYEKMKLGEVTYTFSSCADLLTQIDGAPCGVLEHLENGEWVK